MLQTLRFSNFKSWPEAALDCAVITGVFGTNSSGKTSLIQFLLLLKQTKDVTDRAVSLSLNGEFVQLGTIRDAIHQHNESFTIHWSLTFKPQEKIELRDYSLAPQSASFAQSDIMTVESDIVSRAEAPVATLLRYTVSDQIFSLRRRAGGAPKFDLLPNSAQPAPGGFSLPAFPRPSVGATWAGEGICVPRPSSDVLSK